MNHQDHVELLRRAVPGPGGVWADLGSGEGAFTLALRELVGADGVIYSVDKHDPSLDAQRRAFRLQFPISRVHFIKADFTQTLSLPPLDGVVMANSLHYVRDKDAMLERVVRWLKPSGRFILVEYNVDLGNPWVPYPLSFQSFVKLAARSHLRDPELLATRPSRFLREIYSAQAFRVVTEPTRIR